jgi:uncharacterized protein
LEKRPQKRIFIGLLVFTCLVLSLLIFFLWYVPIVGMQNIHPKLPMIFSGILGGLLVIMFFGGVLLVLTVLMGKDFLFSHRLRGVVRGLFPFMILVGKTIGIPRERIQQSFIEVNNNLVRSNSHGSTPKKILILLPHCIQDFDCQIKITGNIRNCKGCGKCEIKDLIELSDQYGIKIAVATGGTLARRIIVENRPDAIVAVACELDLTSGILDSYPIPVVGILNERPHGPCINTKVDIQKVKSAIAGFCETKHPRTV